MHIKPYMKLVVVSLLTFVLLGCGEEEEAKKLGFSSASEMNDIHAKGWHTKSQYNEDRAKAAGFASFSEMEKAAEAKRRADEEQRVQASKAAGFKTVNEMDEANKLGINNGQDWNKEQARKKFKDKYRDANSALEKSLIVLVSSPSDFQVYKDDGGLNVMNKWRGYNVTLAEVEYTSKVLTFFHITVESDYANKEKPATVNNIKRDLVDECGLDWDSKGRSDVYWSDSNFSRCEVSEARSAGYNIVVSVKKGN